MAGRKVKKAGHRRATLNHDCHVHITTGVTTFGQAHSRPCTTRVVWGPECHLRFGNTFLSRHSIHSSTSFVKVPSYGSPFSVGTQRDFSRKFVCPQTLPSRHTSNPSENTPPQTSGGACRTLQSYPSSSSPSSARDCCATTSSSSWRTIIQ